MAIMALGSVATPNSAISWKCFPEGSVDDKSTLVDVIAWCNSVGVCLVNIKWWNNSETHLRNSLYYRLKTIVPRLYLIAWSRFNISTFTKTILVWIYNVRYFVISSVHSHCRIPCNVIYLDIIWKYQHRFCLFLIFANKGTEHRGDNKKGRSAMIMGWTDMIYHGRKCDVFL